MKKSHLIECPFCRNTVEIEATTGRILGKWEKQDKNKPPEERFKDIFEKEKKTKERLSEYFQGAQSQIQEKKKKADELFKEGLKKMQKGETDQ